MFARITQGTPAPKAEANSRETGEPKPQRRFEGRSGREWRNYSREGQRSQHHPANCFRHQSKTLFLSSGSQLGKKKEACPCECYGVIQQFNGELAIR